MSTKWKCKSAVEWRANALRGRRRNRGREWQWGLKSENQQSDKSL